jgi:hypothetical protein
MDYNSNRKKLILPEYGRHVQTMVDHAVSIEDPEERKRCANTIIGIMGNMFPHLRDVSDFKHKLWDHLAIMAEFKLDIQYPYDLPEAATFQTKPLKVPYQNQKIKFMHYGKITEQMIEKAITHENEDEKKILTQLIANHMKKSLFNFNKELATDERVTLDIKLMSNGQLALDENFKIIEFRDNQNQNTGLNQGQSATFNRFKKKRLVKK